MKIKVTRMNFINKALDAMKDDPLGALFCSFGKNVELVPEEQEIYINTDYIVVIDESLPECLGHGAFIVHFAIGKDKMQIMYIKNSDKERLINAWKGENIILDEGIYNVVDGCHAISMNDGKIVKVEHET